MIADASKMSNIATVMLIAAITFVEIVRNFVDINRIEQQNTNDTAYNIPMLMLYAKNI